jgi:hypothetical protein
MEQQVNMLQKNQDQVGNIINNINNQGQTGHESGAVVKQNVFNENRRMMLEMMAPINSQLNDMKLLYENTKSTSTNLEDKIDVLKKVMQKQVDSLHSGTGQPSS